MGIIVSSKCIPEITFPQHSHCMVCPQRHTCNHCPTAFPLHDVFTASDVELLIVIQATSAYLISTKYKTW